MKWNKIKRTFSKQFININSNNFNLSSIPKFLNCETSIQFPPITSLQSKHSVQYESDHMRIDCENVPSIRWDRYEWEERWIKQLYRVIEEAVDEMDRLWCGNSAGKFGGESVYWMLRSVIRMGKLTLVNAD